MTDQTAAPRPVPTFADRTATDAPLPTWLPDALEELRAERVKTGRLEGDLRSQTRAVRELTAERDAARQELGAAGDVLAVVRDAAERIDRALATYDTQPTEPAAVVFTRPVGYASDIEQDERDALTAPLRRCALIKNAAPEATHE